MDRGVLKKVAPDPPHHRTQLPPRIPCPEHATWRLMATEASSTRDLLSLTLSLQALGQTKSPANPIMQGFAEEIQEPGRL
ncbi:MAG: hypothetical protein ACI8PQ_002678 [Planctomycetota bacterium]|jgi:hypothetical protein